jgi:hypothetical protein
VKRFVIPIVLAAIPAGLPVLAASDAGASHSGGKIPDDTVTTSRSEADNSSASAAITMIGILSE